MKKLFTLLTLALMSIGSAWAASVSDLKTISSDFTFIADDITSNGTAKLTANTLYLDGYIFAPTANSVSTGKGSSTIGGVEHLNSLRLKNTQDQLAFKVSGACKVIFYTQPHASRGIQVGSKAGGTEFGSQTASTSTWECEITKGGTVYLSSYNGDFYFAGFEVKFKAIATQAFSGVKVGGTTLTANASTNGYSVSSNTITLSDDIESIAAPDNIKLVNHITYTDESTKDDEVDVTFDGTVTAGYFIGTATIGATDYTVRVKKIATAAVALSSTSGSISLTESWKTGSLTVTLTGANLTNGEYDVTADVTGMTITPATFTVASGSVNQEFTITSTDKSAAKTIFTFGNAGMGVAAPTYTVNYSQSSPKRNVKQTDVTSTTTWDWTKCGGASIELTTSTIPANGEEFLLAELPEITNDATFNSQALKVTCQWPNRGTGYYIQGTSVKFTTTVPGTVQVWFSNTSDRDDNAKNRRYLYINETNSGVYTLKQTEFANTERIAVPAGEVVINAYTGEDTPAATMVRINKIVFTELATAEVNSTYGWATFVSDKALDFTGISGVKAYIVTGHEGNAITTTQMTGTVPANTPLLLEGATTAIPVAASSSTDVSANKLVAGTGAAVSAESGKTKYVLSAKEGNAVFKKINANAATVPAGKAYLEFDEVISAPELDIVFNGDVTGISATLVNNEKVNSEVYDLQGRKVMNPAKGLYIVNGRKVIIK